MKSHIGRKVEGVSHQICRSLTVTTGATVYVVSGCDRDYVTSEVPDRSQTTPQATAIFASGRRRECCGTAGSVAVLTKNPAVLDEDATSAPESINSRVTFA